MTPHEIVEQVGALMREGEPRTSRKLSQFGIDGSAEEPETGNVQFFFRGVRRVEAIERDKETGAETPVLTPIDGFTLNPNEDWKIVAFFLARPPAN